MATTFTERVLTHLETGSPLPTDMNYALDLSQITRILLKDGAWHQVHRTTAADEAACAETIAKFRKQSDQLAKGKTDLEIAAEYPSIFPDRASPRSRSRPLRQIMVNGERWWSWTELRIAHREMPLVAQVMSRFSEIIAIDTEQSR